MCYRCCICDKPLVGVSWVCSECKERWGLKRAYRYWPRWAKALAQAEKRRRRRADWEREHLVPFSRCPQAERLAYGEYGCT